MGTLKATCVKSLVCKLCGADLLALLRKAHARTTSAKKGLVRFDRRGRTAPDHYFLQPSTWSCFLNRFKIPGLQEVNQVFKRHAKGREKPAKVQRQTRFWEKKYRTTPTILISMCVLIFLQCTISSIFITT